MVFTPEYKDVDKQSNDWYSTYEQNNLRGAESIRFSACGDQWRSDTLTDRGYSNKESLVFNTTLKFLKNFKSQIRQIEFSIGLWARMDDADVAQTNTFRLLLDHLVLAKQFVDRMSDAFDKAADYGYSFLELNYDYDSDETLCLSPVIRFHENPSIAFWDKNAKSPFKTDGRFCGIRQKTSKQDFLSKYPEYKNDCPWLKDQENDFIRYWYMLKEPADFMLLKGGVYKREDLITEDDELAEDIDVQDEKSGLYRQKLKKKGYKKCVYYMQYCNEHPLGKPKEFPCDRLPLVYHPGFKVWTEDGEETYPFTYSLQGVQQLLNYTHSQLATTIKNITGDKWIFAPEHLSTDKAVEYAKNINTHSGAMEFPQTADGVPIRREQPGDVPYALMEYTQSIGNMANDISGAFFNPQNTENVVVSGKALDKITQSMNVIQIGPISWQVGFVNECAAGIKSMVPKLYTEERLIIARKKDSTSQPIVINKPNGTGGLINNIKDLSNNYVYELTSNATATMVKENTLKYLQMMYSIEPKLFELTGDIFARNLDIPDAQELELRIKANMDPMLIKFSDGEVTIQEYQQYKAKNSQMQQQQQMLLMQEQQAKTSKLQNEAQAVSMRAQGDMQKAQAVMQDSNTKSQIAMTNASLQQANTQISAQKVMGEQQQRATQQALDETHMQYEREKTMLEHSGKVVDQALNLHGIHQQVLQPIRQQAMQPQDNGVDDDSTSQQSD